MQGSEATWLSHPIEAGSSAGGGGEIVIQDFRKSDLQPPS